MQPETRFKNKIRPILEALPNTVVFKIQQVCIVGTPDFLLCVNGNFVALELKRNSNARVTALQHHNLQRVSRAKGYSIICFPENWSDVLRFLTSLANGDQSAAEAHLQQIA